MLLWYLLHGDHRATATERRWDGEGRAMVEGNGVSVSQDILGDYIDANVGT